jgi:AraC-like DNA-binding protein
MSFSKVKVCMIFCLIVLSTYAQDTLFIQSHDFEKYVNNISTDGQNLYLRIGDSIYSYSNGKKKYITTGALRFSWIQKNAYADNYYWYHDEQIPKIYSSSNDNLNRILPGPKNAFITKARLNSSLFICYNGNVLEYKINELPKLEYYAKSIRHIYSDDNLRVISTYSGVFSEKIAGKNKLDFNGEKIFPYSHGEFTKIGSDFYLCQSTKVYKYNEEENKLEEFQNFKENGLVRQLIEFGNNVFLVSLEGLALLDLENKKVSEPLIKDKISRATKIGSELIVVTKTGAIYRVSNKFKIDKIQTNFSFEDVEQVNDEIFIGGRSGLFELKGQQLINLNNAIDFYELHEFNGYLIFSNFNGLYAWINSSPIPIVSNVEFNRYALNHDKLLFYAGSINGLYVIKTYDFDKWLSAQKIKNIYKINNDSRVKIYSIYGLLILIIISLTIISIRYRNKLQKRALQRTEKDFSIEFIEKIIRDYKIVSVEDLANHLNISRVQLNRKLSKKGKTALAVLIDCKKEIAIEMHQKGLSIKDISSRVGYSERYIKEKFLNKPESV